MTTPVTPPRFDEVEIIEEDESLHAPNNEISTKIASPIESIRVDCDTNDTGDAIETVDTSIPISPSSESIMKVIPGSGSFAIHDTLSKDLEIEFLPEADDDNKDVL
eukprot:CAMPEP_0195525644 /NCGR_PEP_ID=MMETSP0794_2-20130614/26176_1 /TAXON_ID=515487 /ORGANISM="Stephanopyxis turris, Strain CCMP 815" /LENGTH=105 /DNA_ID=CAMNT_0040656141 /DNA_START=67 /DNA_END=381 /DNA_ORIENTATION=-